MNRKTVTEIPWSNVKKWITDAWYPLPVGYMERNQEEYIIDGYRIYIADRTSEFAKKGGDVICLSMPTMTFSQAVDVCESRNGWALLWKEE